MFCTRHNSRAHLYVRVVMARSSAAISLLLLVLLILDSPHTTLALRDGTYKRDPGSSPPPPHQPAGPVGSFPPPPQLLGPAATSAPNPANAVPPPGPPQWQPVTWDGSFPPSDYRADNVSQSFLLWPESLPYARFVYVCQQTSVPTNRKLTDFLYQESEGKLQVRPYFDLGWVDKHYAPFFRHWRIDWRVDIHRLVCPVVCEYTDLQRLYEYRLYKNVLLRGFACGLIALAILQVGVLLSITFLWVANSNSVPRTADGVAFLWEWCKNLENFCPDWVHLVLLNMVGFAMMEAAGHSNFFEWRSMLFYNFGVTYSYLTLLAILSSTLFQCAQFSSRTSPVPATLSRSLSRTSSVPATPPQSLPRKASTKKVGPLLEAATSLDYESTMDLQKVWHSDDWKYQRIFGQMGVLILMSMYLLLVDDDEGKGMDSLASVIVGAIVVACIWSFAVATVVAMRSVRRLGGGLFRKISCTRKSKPSPSIV